MNRRVWIKQLLIAGGGVLILPACMQDDGAVSVALKNISISGKDEQLFSAITEAIIPQTDTLGAKALNLHQFVLKMFDDCYDPAQQKNLVAGLKQFNSYSEENAGDKFTALNNEKQLDLLKEISGKSGVNSDLKFFLAETRSWTVKGYKNSEYVLTKLRPYELIPGRFHGCVSINKAS